jgi:hypothetical protein
VDKSHYTMMPEEIERIANRAAERAVADVFARLGIDSEDSDERRSIIEDFIYLRRQRQGSEEIVKWAKRGVLSIFLSAMAWVLWEGFKAAMRVKGGQ